MDNITPMYNKALAEVNVILTSVDTECETNIIQEEYSPLLVFCKALDNSCLMDSQKERVIKSLYKFIETGLLSPLTLKDDEFNGIHPSGKRLNKRYAPIYKKDNIVYNGQAFKVLIRAEYLHKENKQKSICNYDNFVDRVYISKGGVITGEYIEDCIIRDEIVQKGSFNIQSIIKIPVCMIIDDDNIIYAVDHREPKIKILKEFYDVPIKIDNDIKGKYNIRNYKKLEK